MREAQRFPGVWRLETGLSRKKKRVETAKDKKKKRVEKSPFSGFKLKNKYASERSEHRMFIFDLLDQSPA